MCWWQTCRREQGQSRAFAAHRLQGNPFRGPAIRHSAGLRERRTMETDEKALYLYCFARSNFLGGLEGPGIDGLNPPLVFRRFPNPCAIASEVAVEDFCGAAAAVRLRDAAWVGPRAARHEAVVEEAMRGSPVLPVRFGTLFLNQEELAEFLDQQRTVISEFLEQVSGLEEWSVRGLLDRWRAGRAFAAAIPPSPEEQFAARTPGQDSVCRAPSPFWVGQRTEPLDRGDALAGHARPDGPGLGLLRMPEDRPCVPGKRGRSGDGLCLSLAAPRRGGFPPTDR